MNRVLNHQPFSSAILIFIILAGSQCQRIEPMKSNENGKSNLNKLTDQIPNLLNQEGLASRNLQAPDFGGLFITGGWSAQTTCAKFATSNPFQILWNAIYLFNDFSVNQNNGSSVIKGIFTQVVAGQNAAIIYELNLASYGQPVYLGVRLFKPLSPSNTPILKGFVVSRNVDEILSLLNLPSANLTLSCSGKAFKNGLESGVLVGAWTSQTQCKSLFGQNPFNYLQAGVISLVDFYQGSKITLITSQVVAGFNARYAFKLVQGANTSYFAIELFQGLGNVNPAITRMFYSQNQAEILSFCNADVSEMTLSCARDSFN